MTPRYIAGALAAVMLSACETAPAAAPQDAVISNPGAQALEEISGAVSTALGGRKTLLAADVLTQQAALIIDPKYVDDRSRQRPNHFRLQTTGSGCHLLHEETGQTYPLRKTRCAPL